MSLLSILSAFTLGDMQGFYRGIPFTWDTQLLSDETGRRTLRFVFPDRDDSEFVDLGAYDGDIVVRGIVVGDDANHQLDRLRDAVRTPGPATLSGPFLGNIQVVQKPGVMPRFTYSPGQLRVGRFEMTVVRFTPRPVTQTNTLQRLLDMLTDTRAQAYALLGDVLAPAALAMTAVAQVESLAGELGSTLTGLVAACSNPLVGLAGALPIEALSSLIGVAPSAEYATTVGAALAAPTQAIAATSAPVQPAAVAPGGSTVAPTPVDGRITAALILSAVSTVSVPTASGAPVEIPPGPALTLALRAFMLADAVNAASTIAWDSQQEGMTWRDTVTAALDAAIAAAAAQMQAYPSSATALWQALIAARAAWIADMNSDIGRLPPVMIFTPPAAAPVWAYVSFLYGDDTRRILPMWADFIRRNRIAHPSRPGPGPFEVLL